MTVVWRDFGIPFRGRAHPAGRLQMPFVKRAGVHCDTMALGTEARRGR